MRKKNLFGYLLSLLGGKKRTKRIEVQLSKENIAELKTRLYHLMETEKPYLHIGYHMKDMADDLHIPVYQLSAFINQVIGMHFTDYMNQYRVRYCEELLKSNMDSRLSFRDLGFRCGFQNRNSFAAAFKKFTGLRPSDYLKNLQS
jgi:YesN/AraC family two-component response regulator